MKKSLLERLVGTHPGLEIRRDFSPWVYWSGQRGFEGSGGRPRRIASITAEEVLLMENRVGFVEKCL